jgi:TetR/AcrR family transcriptional regulator, transcriptional repressor of bet genes
MTRPHAARPERSTVSARPRASRERQRQRLIDACISALHVYGPSNTTVEKVVAIARMSPGIVRFYFESKAAMLVASLEYLAAEFEDRCLVPVAALKATPVAALERLVELYLGTEIASARKVSVWYSFWGEASSRQEYYDICGKRDQQFEVLVRELIGRLIEESRARHLDADAIALGLIGVLEMLWQSYAFQTESTIDRHAARRRCMAYLRSVFPTLFSDASGAAATDELPASAYRSPALFEAERDELFKGSWQFAGLEGELATAGGYLTLDAPATRALVVRQPGGGLRAFHNACQQRPHALAGGHTGRLGEAIECALHGLRYSLAGEPLAGTPGSALPELEVTSVAGFIFVRAPTERDAGPLPLAAVLATAASPSALAAWPSEVEFDADWKLVVENWLETTAALPVSGPADRSVEARGGPASGSFLDSRSQPTRSYVAPNQVIDLYSDAVIVSSVFPTGPGRSRLRGLAYRSGGPAGAERALARLAARLEAEAALAESVQRGLDVPRTPGGPLQQAPAPLTEFRHIIARLLPGGQRPPGDPT